MKVIKTLAEYKDHCNKLYSASEVTSFVPTMGFLHRGHLSLIEKAKEASNYVIVSIFVNPTQFNDKNDFEKYPIDIENDLEKLKRLKVDCVFIPSEKEIYPEGNPDIIIDYPELTNKLCGEYRHGHFQGVLQIVHNLLIWTKPKFAIFGRKDYQQLLLISKMAKDLHLDTKIIGAPLIRDDDGLALSSRNARLSKEGRNSALALSKTLLTLSNQSKHGEIKTVYQAASLLKEQLSAIEVEYAGIYDLQQLTEKEKEESLNKTLIAAAIHVDGVRLIDNIILD